MRITTDDLRGPAIIAFLEAHVAQLRTLSPPESSHALDLEGLRSPDVRFWTAIDDDSEFRDGSRPLSLRSSRRRALLNLPPFSRSSQAQTAGREILGCAALKTLDPTHAELKSMRTAPKRTRQGIASRLVRHVLDEARAAGFARISLETGSEEFFAPARALYARHGFAYCEPFAGYRPDPLSVFMTRSL